MGDGVHRANKVDYSLKMLRHYTNGKCFKRAVLIESFFLLILDGKVEHYY